MASLLLVPNEYSVDTVPALQEMLTLVTPDCDIVPVPLVTVQLSAAGLACTVMLYVEPGVAGIAKDVALADTA